jgi:hypothetical protein
MIKKLLLCVLTIVVITSKAQSPFPSPFVVSNVDWKRYYSQAASMHSAPNALDVNSNFYSTGYTGSLSQKKLIVLKYDSTGAQIYSYLYNIGGSAEGNAIRVDGFGNALIGGVSDNIAAARQKDFVIMKLSPMGAPLWPSVVLFDGGANRDDEALGLVIDANGDVYCTGRSEASSGISNILTIKLSGMNGTVLWQHVYNGGGGDDLPSAIGISEDGQRVFVTGHTMDFSTATTDIVTYALDANTGGYYWPPVVSSNPGNDYSRALIVKNGDVFVCGEKDNFPMGVGTDYVTLRYDGLSGSILWSQDYDHGGTDQSATDLACDSAGNIGVVGKSFNGSTYEYHTVLYDNSGAQYGLNIEQTGMPSLSADPHICNDTIAHHWYVSGEKLKATKDIFVYQITPGGTTSWREMIDGQNGDVDAATGIAVNGIGVVYVGGLAKNSLAEYDYTSIKINQTPLYWPPDFSNQPVNKSHLYLRNAGQLMRTDSTPANEVLYYTHNTSPEIFIEQNAVNFVYNRSDTIESTLDTLERIQVQFLGCNTLANYHEYLPGTTRYNYFLGYATSPNIEDIRGNQRIFVPNFYPYIDLHYFSGPGGLKWYFVIKPGGRLENVRMLVNGAIGHGVDPGQGDALIMDGHLGRIKLEKPVAYTINWLGAVVPITTGSAEWSHYAGDLYNISPPVYNSSWPLIIQISAAQTSTPSLVNTANLDYSTYYGGLGNERFFDIAVASNGDRHVTGYADAMIFPAVNSLQQFQGQQDVVFLKHTADDTLRYASFIGGSGPDIANSIAVNVHQEVFVGGQTNSTDFRVEFLPGATNGTVNGFAGGGLHKQDGFMFKYIPHNPVGQRLVWSRYFAGERADAITSVYVDAWGYVYFSGWTGSVSFPTTPGAAQPSMGIPWGVAMNIDAVFGKLKPTLQNDWITLCGSTHNSGHSTATEQGLDITIDNNRNVIGCGYTETSGTGQFNGTGNPNTFWQNAKRGPTDGFLVVYSETGQLKFRAFLGGDGGDKVTNLAHDFYTNNTYFAGVSDNPANFPFVTKSGATNSQFKARQNAFVGYMDGDLTKQWCSYYGKGANKDYFTKGLAVDKDGLVYLGGYTSSDTLEAPVTPPVTPVFQDSVLKGGFDGFIAIYSPFKELYNAHYFGGTKEDMINSLAVGQNQRLWVTGNTEGPNFPIAYNAINASLIDSVYASGQDGFISGFQLLNYQVTPIQEYAFDKSVISMYPNPSNSHFYIELEEPYAKGTEIRVYNLTGQLIHEEKTRNTTTQISCESWSNGVYLISVTNNTAYGSFKFIKQ